MTPLEHTIRESIRRNGPMKVGAYMDAVLGDPEHGYYRTRDRFGAAGDFTTAPEISQVFGELIGLWCAVAWQQMGALSPVTLIELGPGRGTLMADALRAARTAPDFVAAIAVHLVETSPVLRRAQGTTLAGLAPDGTRWHDRLADVPAGPALLIANEFFDALPVDQYVRTDHGWRPVRIAVDGGSGGLGFDRAGAPVDAGSVIPRAMRDAPPGSICEVGRRREAVAREIGARLAAHGGAALIVDYGPARSAPGDSLQAVRGHRYVDVLAEPGEADLTAHVDFQAIAEAAESAGARAHGPVPQGVFLERIGIAARAGRLMDATGDGDRAGQITGACRRLTDPAQMGALFKALAITHPAHPVPAGFEAP